MAKALQFYKSENPEDVDLSLIIELSQELLTSGSAQEGGLLKVLSGIICSGLLESESNC